MDAIVKAHDGNVQMIDSSIVRVHQHASGVEKVEIVVWGEAAAASRRKSRARRCAGRPVQLLISPGNITTWRMPSRCSKASSMVPSSLPTRLRR